MTEVVVTPEDEARVAVREQYDMITTQQEEYGWRTAIIDTGDYLVIFVSIQKPQGRTFTMRLRCDDYPEQAPELRFVAPAAFDQPAEAWQPAAEFYPRGDNIVNEPQRLHLPVPCIKGHRDYYAKAWHQGWTSPPAHDHSLYQLVVNVRNAILDRWT